MCTIEKKGISLIGMNDNMGYGENALSRREDLGGCISISDTIVHFYNELPCDPHTQPQPPPARVHHSYR